MERRGTSKTGQDTIHPFRQKSRKNRLLPTRLAIAGTKPRKGGVKTSRNIKNQEELGVKKWA
jgi:hypothetical protein